MANYTQVINEHANALVTETESVSASAQDIGVEAEHVISGALDITNAVQTFKTATAAPTGDESALIAAVEAAVKSIEDSAGKIKSDADDVRTANADVTKHVAGITGALPVDNPLIVPASGNVPHVHLGQNPNGTASQPGFDATGPGVGATADLQRTTV